MPPGTRLSRGRSPRLRSAGQRDERDHGSDERPLAMHFSSTPGKAQIQLGIRGALDPRADRALRQPRVDDLPGSNVLAFVTTVPFESVTIA